MTLKRTSYSAAVLVFGMTGIAAQELPSMKTLPLSLANEAALEAVATCKRNGYSVTATVVDASGLVKTVAKGDGTQPHTLDSSRAKAYTIVTLGPIFGDAANGSLTDKVLASPKSQQLAHIPGILLLAGGIILKSGNDVIGAIGVGGAPGGDKDETCAKAGADKIADRLRST